MEEWGAGVGLGKKFWRWCRKTGGGVLTHLEGCCGDSCLVFESLGLERRRKQEAKKWARMDFLIRQQREKGERVDPPGCQATRGAHLNLGFKAAAPVAEGV